MAKNEKEKSESVELAVFMCLTCARVWTSAPGYTSCPHCGAAYVKWVSFRDKVKVISHALQE